MRGAGAAKRREQEPSPDKASIEADLMRVIAGSADIAGRIRRHDGAVAGIIANLERLAAGRPDAEHLAALADRLRVRHEQVAILLIDLAAHNAEARQAAENLASVLGANAMMREAWIAEGRRREAAERDAQPRPRAAGSHRKRHLKPVPGMTSTAVRAAVAAGVAAATVTGSLAAMHEESSVRTVASAPAAAGDAHAMAPDSAVPMPSWSPRPPYVPKHAKPSADAASASPAPSPSSSPSSTAPAPPLPSPAASHVNFDGHLDVQTAECVITSAGGCAITFSAVGGEVSWSAWASSPDLSLSAVGGTLADGHPGTVVVTVRAGALAGAGTVTLTDGHGNATQVQVSWVALPAI